MSEEDGTWLRSAYFLRWKKPPNTNMTDGQVDFVLFSATRALRADFEMLRDRQDWEDVLIDPLCLLTFVLHDLFRQINEAITKVRLAFRPVEHVSMAAIHREYSMTKNFRACYNLPVKLERERNSTSSKSIT